MARTVNHEKNKFKSVLREGVEEKGRRAARSTDVYVPKEGLSDGTSCRECGMTYKSKRWTLEKVETSGVKILCPACKRMHDHTPAGVVHLSGSYLQDHKEEIMNTLRHTEATSRTKNPLGRIMDITEDAEGITVTTTEEKLAQKLGREVYKSQSGELHYKWNRDNNLVRVEWMR
ncbi:hypothetical protein LPW11_14280 [Geomonas sp. RF6]|uniref:BCAM0308 family protein n=1 Tax=Geomonas sp. RF6 TaxID=2897342 RepID=UPI001E5AAD7D|nr:BCAM0308 family protein [Geomonas sp. RF6]UFS69058.1 hypothetical protein LPW11_14280 [Geomonas sp. RF6]